MVNVFLFGQGKIARDSDPLKFEEEDLILKVGECLEARTYLYYFFHYFKGSASPSIIQLLGVFPFWGLYYFN